jgi:hypothetical protein
VRFQVRGVPELAAGSVWRMGDARRSVLVASRLASTNRRAASFARDRLIMSLKVPSPRSMLHIFNAGRTGSVYLMLLFGSTRVAVNPYDPYGHIPINWGF